MDQDLKTENTSDISTQEELHKEQAAPAADEAYEQLVKENQEVLGDELEDNADPESSEDAAQETVDDRDAVIAALQGQVAKMLTDREEMMRQVADAINGRRRAEADVEKARKFAIEGFVKALLPVVDALDRALEVSDKTNPVLKPTLDGVEGTMQLFLKELSNFGVVRIDPVGEVFDPNQHQAIAMAESAEVKANHVLSVMQKGFILNGRVVRPAMVVVSKGAPQPAESQAENIQA